MALADIKHYANFDGVLQVVEKAMVDGSGTGVSHMPGSAPNMIALWDASLILQMATEVFSDFPNSDTRDRTERIASLAKRLVEFLDYKLRRGWTELSTYSL